jgi:membrane-associated PAP2 superfamily phosphatase
MPVGPLLHAERASGRNFYRWHLGIPLVGALLLLLLEMTQFDDLVSDWFYDAATERFPLRYNAMFEIVTHHWAKYLVVLIGFAVVASYAMSFVISALRDRRRLLLFLSLALTLAPAAVSLLKAASLKHCPYDLVEYGGYAMHLSLFDAAVPGQRPGHCFPSGHASAGFCLLAFYFAGLALGNRRLARWGLWGGLATGMLFGMARVVQGAHFISHNLWSALVCWLVILALYILIMGPPKTTPAAGAVTNAG